MSKGLVATVGNKGPAAAVYLRRGGDERQLPTLKQIFEFAQGGWLLPWGLANRAVYHILDVGDNFTLGDNRERQPVRALNEYPILPCEPSSKAPVIEYKEKYFFCLSSCNHGEVISPLYW